jgi:O-antigen ligase
MTARLGIRDRSTVMPAAVGVWASAAVLAPGIGWKLALLTPPIGIAAVWLVAARPEWGLLFLLAAALLTPPLPFAAGNSGAHFAPLAASVLVVAGALRFHDWRSSRGGLPVLFIAFTGWLAASSGLALFYSGWQVAAGSLARVFLFAIAVWIYLYARAAPFSEAWDSLRLARWMFTIAAGDALFACADFYFQMPSTAAFAPQFVWTDSGVYRRAQGMFYEASTLGNFCAFALAVIPAALLTPQRYRPIRLAVIVLGSLPIAGALLLSYSRGSLANLAVVAVTFLVLRGKRGLTLRSLLWPVLALAGAAAAGIVFFPAFLSLYWARLQAVFEYFIVSPNWVLSGRLANWAAVIDFLGSHPWLALFGIGYKTLPYTSYAGGGVIADNTYLSLLVETGIVGLGLFLALNVAILRTALRAARSANGRAVFFGSWIFCFWCGELVQMMSGDLITYWRVLPAYFCTLAIAAREAGE